MRSLVVCLSVLFVLIGINKHTLAQEIDELLELHLKNQRALYGGRGVPPEWILNGNVTTADLVSILKGYPDNVGILMYTQTGDTLIINLLNKMGVVLEKKQFYRKDSLIVQISKANQKFSGNFTSRAAGKRGLIDINADFNISAAEISFSDLNNTLLPFKDDIKQFAHLIIVPTLNIATLPFAAFKLTEKEYLIDFMSYSIAPSLLELMVSRQTNTRLQIRSHQQVYFNFTDALIVANPKFPDDPQWNFPDLPGALKEVKNISRFIDSSAINLLTGNAAKPTLIKENICQYDLLYFATHGIADEKHPLDSSFLVLTDESGNYRLTTREIQNIRYNCLLKANLVVLSACQTGLGMKHDGGIIGLSRAFQISGANHIVMSLWSINDEQTAQLMGYFFEFLKQGNRLMPHQALRQAILKYKKEIIDNPEYWASFAIFGIPY